ncbi:MAG: transglutaminase family protein [Planctomycetota bacterium]
MTSSPFSRMRPAIRPRLEAAAKRLAQAEAFEDAILAIYDQILPGGSAGRALADLEEQVRARLVSDRPKALLAHAHAVLFDELGLRVVAGSLSSLLLDKVIASGRGHPILLALAYKLLMQRLGFHCWGVSLAGRILVSIQVESKSMLIDPAAGGRLVSIEEAVARSKELASPQGPARNPVPLYDNRRWLVDLARSLSESLTVSGRAEDAEACAQAAAAIAVADSAPSDSRAAGLRPEPRIEGDKDRGSEERSREGGA